MASGDSLDPVTLKLRTEAIVLGGFLLLLWGVRLVDSLRQNAWLKAFGIHPRERLSLMAILFSPFLHRDRSHLLGNSLPLMVLGWFVMLPDMRVFWLVTAVTILVGGFGTWLFGKAGTSHIGASGLVLGYFAHVLTRGFFAQDTNAVLFAFAVAGFYVGLFRLLYWRLPGTSFVGHFWGFLSGILSAWFSTFMPAA